MIPFDWPTFYIFTVAILSALCYSLWRDSLEGHMFRLKLSAATWMYLCDLEAQ